MDKFCFTIADCFIFIRNGANIKQDKKKRGYPITRIETTSNNVFNRDKVGYAGIENITPYQDYVLEDGDLLMSHINSLPYLGRVVYYDRKQNETIIHGMNLLRLKAIRTRLHPRYAIFLFSSVRFKNKILAIAKKSVNQASFSINDLKKISIELPTVEQQSHIVNKLVGIQKIIELRRAQLAKLDELVKCRFVELFGDPVLNERKWKTKTLKELTSKVGSGATPKGGDSAYKDTGISLIRSLNVHNNYFTIKALAHIDDAQAEQLSNVEVHIGDVLLNITGASVARCCIVPDHILPARVNQHVCIIRCNTEINPLFLERLFTSKNFQALLWYVAEGGGGTRQALTKQQIENFTIIVPPYTLQNTFAAFVRRIDKLRFNLSFPSLVGAFCIVEVGDKNE